MSFLALLVILLVFGIILAKVDIDGDARKLLILLLILFVVLWITDFLGWTHIGLR